MSDTTTAVASGSATRTKRKAAPTTVNDDLPVFASVVSTLASAATVARDYTPRRAAEDGLSAVAAAASAFASAPLEAAAAEAADAAASSSASSAMSSLIVATRVKKKAKTLSAHARSIQQLNLQNATIEALTRAYRTAKAANSLESDEEEAEDNKTDTRPVTMANAAAAPEAFAAAAAAASAAASSASSSSAGVPSKAASSVSSNASGAGSSNGLDAVDFLSFTQQQADATALGEPISAAQRRNRVVSTEKQQIRRPDEQHTLTRGIVCIYLCVCVCVCVCCQRTRSTVPFNHDVWRVVGVWIARRCAPDILFWLPFFRKNGVRVRVEVGLDSLLKILAPKKKKKVCKNLDAAETPVPHVRSLFMHVRVVQRVDMEDKGIGDVRYICTDLGVSYRLGNTGHHWAGDQSAATHAHNTREPLQSSCGVSDVGECFLVRVLFFVSPSVRTCFRWVVRIGTRL